MSIPLIKDPEASRTYTFFWSPYLALLGTGVTIANAVWTVAEGLTQDGAPVADGDTTAIKLSGGLVGRLYTSYCKITTSGGDTDRRALLISVQDAATFSEPTENETMLAAVRAALGKSATKNVEEYQIANRMKRERSFTDLLAWENRLVTLVNSERLANRTRNGGSLFQTVHGRFK